MAHCTTNQPYCTAMQPLVQLRRESRKSTHTHPARGNSAETNLLKNLNQFRLSGEFCDVKLKVEERTFFCHRNVLAATSAYFRILVGSNSFKEHGQHIIELHDIKAATFEKLLDFIYGSTLVVEDDLIDLLFASSYLQVQQAEDIIDAIIRNDTDVEDVLKVMTWPGLKLKSGLYQHMRETVCTYFERISRSDEFLKLPFSMLEEILSSADLLVTDKDHLVDSVIRWICHDVGKRFDDVEPAFRLISSHFAPSACFSDLLRGVRDSQHQQECLKMIFTGALASKATKSDSPSLPFAYVPTYLYAVGDEVSLLRIRSVKKLPVSMRSFEHVEAALLNENIYLTVPQSLASDGQTSLSAGGGHSFYRCRTDTYKWESLPATRGVCRDLLAFNGTLYAYQQCGTNHHQFYAFAGQLNRWFGLPPSNVVRENAGVTCDARALYAVGGYPVNAFSPSESAIQMYDCRCRSWMNIVPTNKAVSLFHVNLSKRVVFFEGCLYVLYENTFDVLEMRSKRWLNDHLVSSYPSKPRFAFPGKTHLLLIDTNQKFYYYSTSGRMWRKRNANNLLDDVSPLKPVFIPRF